MGGCFYVFIVKNMLSSLYINTLKVDLRLDFFLNGLPKHGFDLSLRSWLVVATSATVISILFFSTEIKTVLLETDTALPEYEILFIK